MVALVGTGDLLARVRAILISPKRAWSFIAVEPPDTFGLYTRYVMPLAAIPPICKLISWSFVFGDMGFGTALAAALLGYVLSLVGVYLLALFAARLAPRFDGEEKLPEALKLVAYAATPSWVAGVFRLVPLLAVLSLLLSLYSVYLLYCGVRALALVPEERALGHTLAVTGAALILFILFAAIIGAVFGIAALGMV